MCVAPSFHGSWVSFLGVCKLVFVAIFTAEVVLKLLSLGPTIYFAEAWNKFDCTVVRGAWRPLLFMAAYTVTLLFAVLPRTGDRVHRLLARER